MENCLIIINRSAGSTDKISFDYVKKALGNRYKYACHTIPSDGEPKLGGYDALAVCGGDGTLSNVLSQVYDKRKDVFYFPYGTLNDKAGASKSLRKNEKTSANAEEHRAIVGVVSRVDCKNRTDEKIPSAQNATVFSYVYATGTFTPIGYTANVKMKKRFGVLAYLFEVLKEYKVERIRAQIVADGNKFKGDFTLVMFIKSPRCFGFKFNKAYDEQAEAGHLVLIRSPKHNGLLGKIEIFFPFFRVFFLGLKREREGNIIFKSFESCTASFDDTIAFCKDGERDEASGKIKIDFQKTECHLNLMKK